MTGEPLDKEALQAEYELIRPKYRRLEDCLKEDLTTSLSNAGVKVLDVDSRVKPFQSLWDKAQRTRCEKPLDDIKDICGLRVICYYRSDLQQVSHVIEEELGVIEREDKADSLGPAEFGYLSVHLIVTPKEHWLKTPRYRGLAGLKVEIQIRTVFQHAWAELSHELAYKKKEYVPKRFQRTLYQMSAALEDLDERFDSLHRQKEEYGRVVSQEAEELGRFHVDQELNIDTLQAFLDSHFPDREGSIAGTSGLLDTMVEHNVSIRQLAEGFESLQDILPAIDADMYAGPRAGQKLAQHLIANVILELTNDDIWQIRDSSPVMVWTPVISHWRRKLSEGNRS